MKKILHIIKNPNDPLAMMVIREQLGDHSIEVVLIQDAVGWRPSLPEDRVRVLEEDAKIRQVDPGFKTIRYPELVELIFKVDSVTTW